MFTRVAPFHVWIFGLLDSLFGEHHFRNLMKTSTEASANLTSGGSNTLSAANQSGLSG